jgi:hypothetical protein
MMPSFTGVTVKVPLVWPAGMVRVVVKKS